MEEKKIMCVDCNMEFIFTIRDQEFFNEKGFTEPKRCRACRDKKKASFKNKEVLRGYR